MRTVTKTALAALLVGGLGAMTLAPFANADDSVPAPGTAQPVAAQTATPGPDATPGGWHRPGGMGRFGMAGRAGGLRAQILNIACGDRGAEALEIAFVHMYYAVKPTTAQEPLFDTLKTSALADQKTFADTCKTAMSTDKGDQTILDRLQGRLTFATAQATALGDVLPKFKAFYDSLSADQKAKLDQHNRWAQIGNGMHRMNGQGWQPHQGWRHRLGQPGVPPTDGMNAPGQPADAAPATDDQDSGGAT